MPRIQGIKGEAVFVILRTIDNVGGGALSAFPEGKQKGIKNRHLHLSMGRVNKWHFYLHIALCISYIKTYPVLFTII